jgi:hypothetical protein
MKLKRGFPAFALMLLLPLILWQELDNAWGSDGNSSTGFTIVGADGNNFLSTSGSSELDALIGQVPPRFVLQFAGDSQFYTLEPAPGPLLTLLNQIPPRFVLQFAGNSQFYNLEPAPGPLLTLLNQISPRFVLQYAGGNAFYSTSYPAELIGDTEPPQASNLQVIGNNATQVTVRWNTNQYANSFLEYGTQPGVYTNQISNLLYTLNHQIVIGNLSPGQTYYYRYGSTDRSGNSFLSSPQQFTTQRFVYLPIVTRGQ